MTDEQFLAALEACTLAERDFGHAAHVRAAYLYLRSGGFAGALQSMRSAICRYSASLGKPDRYHETITVAQLALIHESLHAHGDAGSWPLFAQLNPHLFEAGLLLQFYPQPLLASELARRVFLLPRPLPYVNNYSAQR